MVVVVEYVVQVEDMYIYINQLSDLYYFVCFTRINKLLIVIVLYMDMYYMLRILTWLTSS